jgi:hypothetical protein
MAEQEEALARGMLSLAFWILAVAVAAFGFWAAATLSDFAGAHLSNEGRHAIQRGQLAANTALLMLITASNYRRGKRAVGRFIPAKIDPAGNKVLQGVWRETGSIVPRWVGGFAAVAFIAFIAWFWGSDAWTNLTSGGDQPIGYLAGAGSLVIVYIPCVSAVLALAKLGPTAASLLRRPSPTPAPAP